MRASIRGLCAALLVAATCLSAGSAARAQLSLTYSITNLTDISADVVPGNTFFGSNPATNVSTTVTGLVNPLDVFTSNYSMITQSPGTYDRSGTFSFDVTVTPSGGSAVTQTVTQNWTEHVVSDGLTTTGTFQLLASLPGQETVFNLPDGTLTVTGLLDTLNADDFLNPDVTTTHQANFAFVSSVPVPAAPVVLALGAGVFGLGLRRRARGRSTG